MTPPGSDARQTSGPPAAPVAAEARSTQPRPVDASMTLLREVMTRPLDPGYAAAAARRRELGTSGAAGAHGRSVLAVVSVLLVGLLLGGAWWQARGTRPAGVTARAQLAAEIGRQDAAAGELQRENAALAVEIDSERRRQLGLSEQSSLADEVERLGVVTGAVAAVGPGVVVTLDDAESVQPGGSTDPRRPQQNDDGRVLDRDLQLVVNGLWHAGAEAAAINGQRLTALSAIRSAGLAILVDYRPLSPPYRVTAIGDPATLQTRFSTGPGGRDLQYLKDNFGVRVDVASVKRVEVPANAGLDVRRAQSTARRADVPTETDSPSRQQETP